MRYPTIDAMRGLAAIAVLLCHIETNFPWPLNIFMLPLGSIGVPVFFVISGFVIAASNAGQNLTPSYLIRFAARRSLRLDPLYWLILAATWAFLHPSDLSTFLSNMFYVDQAFGHTKIVTTQWSLVQEVQLYLLFVIVMSLCQRLARAIGRSETAVTMIVMAVTALLSLSAARTFGIQRTCVIHNWYYFIAGSMCYWVAIGKLNWRWGAGYLAAVAAFLWDRSRDTLDLEMGVVICTGAFLLIARNRLTTLGSSPDLQFLGRISYSLYISHYLFVQLVNQWLPWGVPRGLVLIIGCLLVATALHHTIEKTSTRWSHQLIAKTGPVFARPPLLAAIPRPNTDHSLSAV